MNRCPNHKCRKLTSSTHSFCNSCGIAVRHCPTCQQNGRDTVNRGDGFFCRRCGSLLPSPPRGVQTQLLFEPHKKNFVTPVLRLALNERSDTFPIISSQSNLWLLTSNNNLRIIENQARELGIYDLMMPGTASLGLEELQQMIKFVAPLTAPIVFRDRLLFLGAQRLLSFSIHPHGSRWLLDRKEINLPDDWQPLFNCESIHHHNFLELPILLKDLHQSALLKLTREMITGQIPIDDKALTTPVPALLIGALDRKGNYCWAKDPRNGSGVIYFIKRRDNGTELIQLNIPPLLFLVRPIVIGERVYAVTEENRLIELVLQQGEVIQSRKLNQVNRGAHLLTVARERVVVAVHESLFFFDLQTGELLSVATDIDASHLFVDGQGNLLAIHRNGNLIMINAAQPLERWGDEDATSDDSRIFDAFIAHNSLYTLSENGEVCRFDFN